MSTPEAPLLERPGPLDSSPLSRSIHSGPNDPLSPEPRRVIDFDAISLQDLGPHDPPEPFEDLVLRIDGFGDDRREEEEDEEEYDVVDEEEGQGDGPRVNIGTPRRLRRSDRSNFGVPPVRYQAGP